MDDYRQDAKRAQAEIVSDLVKLDINRIKNLIDRAIGLKNVFADRTTERKVTGIFEVRHIVIHRAGFIDPKFKKVTKSKSSIDRQINLTRRYALNSIKILKQIAERIENHVRKAS